MAATDDHDIREVLPGDRATPPVFGDFAPTDNEPDPAIYPLPGDVGLGRWSGDYDDLVPVFNTFPEPHVRFITPEHHQWEFGYPPGGAPKVDPGDLPDQSQSRSLSGSSSKASVHMTDTVTEAFRRIGALWNGEFVGPNRVHLLRDKCPRWDALFEGLDEDDLDTLTPTVDERAQTLVDAFGDLEWFDPDRFGFEPMGGAHLSPMYVVRRKVKWAPTQSAKTLLIRNTTLPTPRGDRKELLYHRFGVGCVAAYLAFDLGTRVETYATMDSYKTDAIGWFPDGTAHVYEVITGHHNNALNVRTYQKLEALDEHSTIEPYLVFDSRQTARRVLAYWCRETPAELDASLDSAPQLEWLAKKVRREHANPDRRWPVAGVTTISRLWRQTFGPEAPRRTARELSSLDW